MVFPLPYPPDLVETDVTQPDQFNNDEVDLAETVVREAIQFCGQEHLAYVADTVFWSEGYISRLLRVWKEVVRVVGQEANVVMWWLKSSRSACLSCACIMYI